LNASSLDIAVCGCGPAGLAAALLLHRAGHRVSLFERFDAPRPVGSGLLLQPTGLGVLSELHLLGDIVKLGAPIDRLLGVVSSSGRIALDVSYAAIGPNWQALGIHRAALFDTLYRAVVAHRIPVITSTTVQRHERLDAKKSQIWDAERRELGQFDLIVNALGANSPLSANIARRTVLQYGALWTTVNLPSADSSRFHVNWLEQRYLGARKMAGVLPLGRISSANQTSNSHAMQAAFFWSIKREDLASWQSSPLDNWKSEVAALWPNAVALLDDVTDHAHLTFAQYDHFTARSPYAPGIAHVGDAAHATSPQLGQGANMALLDALALSLALQSSATVDHALHRYTQMRRWHVRLFQFASAIFTPFYQSDNRLWPWLRDWITAPLSRMPIGDAIVARLVSGMTVSPLAGASFKPIALRTRR
jgi:salicylate hydroxylase